MTDNKVLELNPKISLNPAVELSFLKVEEQKALVDIIEYSQCTPSLSQAQKLRSMSKQGTLTIDNIKETLEEEKPNQTPKLKVSMNRLKKILPYSLKNDREREEYVIKAVEFYGNYQKKQREKNQER